MIDPQDVKQPVDSSATEQAVTEPVEQPTAEQSATQEQETAQEPMSPTPEGVKDEGDVDEKGIPYKNRYMESMRYKEKYRELESNLPNIIQQAIEKAIPQTPVAQQQPQYSEEQLIQFKNATEDANARAWAEIELTKLRDRKSEEKFKQLLAETQRKQAFEQEQQQAVGTVMRKYPLMFNADGSWNNDHPLTQRVAQIYNSRPAFKNEGFGLLGAADMAFADYALQQQPSLVQKQQQLKRQIKKMEKATLVEGGGLQQASTAKNPVNVAKEQFARSGSEKDLTALMKAKLKAAGKIP